MRAARKLVPSAVVAIIGAFSAQLWADPPAHAPAHGWRRHHDADYVGYTGEHWDNDYEIASGGCNREAIGAVIGGVAGGVVASHVGDRPVATLIGAVAGALIGAKIGHDIDEADRGCFGHALEIGEPGHRVVWTNESTRVRYELSPGAAQGEGCRAFTLVTVAAGQRGTRTGVACRSASAEWQIRQ
jgi:surface antigen